jgi:hypothetical protein
MLKYKSASPPYYWERHENEKFKETYLNFELPIHYVVKQEAITQGTIVFRGVELVFVTRQEIVVLLKAKPTIVEGVVMVVHNFIFILNCLQSWNMSYPILACVWIVSIIVHKVLVTI